MKLSDISPTKEIEIPGTGIKVTVRDLSWPDFMESIEIQDAKERGVYRLVKVIQDWNITDDEGTKVPVSEDVIRKLPAHVVFPLVEAVKDYFGIEKKKLT